MTLKSATVVASAGLLSCILSFVLLLSLYPASAWSATATINPSADNTLAEELSSNSSGACESVFSGMTDNNVARRALLKFDIAGNIPAGSAGSETVDSHCKS